MIETDLAEWIKDPSNFEWGIDLYAKSGGDEYQLELFKKFDTPYTREKLYDLLKEIYENLKASQKAVAEPNKLKSDFYSLPETLQKAQIEKGQLYKECFPLRNQLKILFKKQLNQLITSKGRVTIAQALDLMRQTYRGRPKPFSIAYVTFNKQTGEGGELIYFEHATLTHTNKGGSKIYQGKSMEKRISKNPLHWKNSTRNIVPLASHEIRKLHIWLILMFDGMEVTMGDPG